MTEAIARCHTATPGAPTHDPSRCQPASASLLFTSPLALRFRQARQNSRVLLSSRQNSRSDAQRQRRDRSRAAASSHWVCRRPPSSEREPPLAANRKPGLPIGRHDGSLQEEGPLELLPSAATGPPAALATSPSFLPPPLAPTRTDLYS
ncbi:hypothetical protein MRX96_037358 [Rhipicephalus microplus]